MGRLVCGIDVGSTAVRAAVINVGLRRWTPVALLEAPLAVSDDGADPGPDELRRAVADLASRIPPGVDGFSTAVAGDRTTVRQLGFPRAALRQADAAIRLELDGVLPFEVSEAVFDHVATSGPSDDPARLLVVVARSETVRTLAELLATAKMDPEAVGVGALPLAELMAAGGTAGSGETVCLADIGRTTTDLVVLRDRRPVFVRSLRAGSGDLTAAIAKTYRTSRSGAEDLKRRIAIPSDKPAPGDAAGAALLEAVDAGLAPLIAPLRRTLLELRGAESDGTRVERLCITGGGALVRGMPEYLSSRLGVPTEPLSGLIGPVEGLDPDSLPVFGRAIGIALSAGAARSRTIDLRRGDLKYRGDTAAIRSRFRGLAISLAVLLAAWGLGAWSRCSSLDAEASGQRKALGRLTNEMMGRSQTDFAVVRRLLDKVDSPVEGPLPHADVLAILDELSYRMPADIRNSVTILDIAPGKLTMNGLTRNAEEAARIPKVLAEFTECVRDVGTLSGSGSTDDYTYQIEATTRCP